MTRPQPPSSVLPPLKRLSQYASTDITPLLKLLRDLYLCEEVHGGRVPKTFNDSGYASEASDDEDGEPVGASEESMDSLRADKFEKAFAMKWLVGFVARGEEWAYETEDEGEQERRMNVMDEVATLVGAISGLGTGPMMRTFDFPRGDGKDPIVIHIRDASILSQDHTSVGLQTWGSSTILARKLVKTPEEYGLGEDKPLRILELGAGTGQLSMVLAKMLLRADIVATDYHSAVLNNLRSNVSGNFSATEDAHPPKILPLDWRELHDMASSPNPDPSTLEAPFNERFDLIIGADIIYEPQHAAWIKSSVELLLRKDANAAFYLIMPARPTHEHETASVPATFPLADDVREKRPDGANDASQVAILAVESIERMAGTGRMDEMHYLLYRIGWI